METGEYQVLVGASSRDIRCQAKVRVESSHQGEVGSEGDRLPAYLDFPADASVSREDFETLLGYPLPKNNRDKRGTYSINTPLGDIKWTLTGCWLRRTIKKQVEERVGKDPTSPNALIIQAAVREIPLRALLIWGGEGVTRALLDGLVTMLNGRFFKGLVAALRAIRKQS